MNIFAIYALCAASVTLAIAAVSGWVMNIFTLFSTFDTASVSETLIRVAGIPVPFIGAIMGYM